MNRHTSRRVIFAALFGNTAIALTKTGAACLTGSAAMASEAIHSFADTGNQLLLLLGMRQATRPPTADHPFGFGLRLYFWSFIVAMLIFGLGSGAAFLEAAHKWQDPTPMRHPWVNVGVLLVSMGFEGAVWRTAFRAFRAQKGDLGWVQAIRTSKDPTVFTVLFEDTAALLGLLLALAGVGLSQWLDLPRFDAVASLLIGVVLALTALMLAAQSQHLLTGAAVRPEVRRVITRLALTQPGVLRVNELLTMHFSPQDVLVTLSLDFDDGLVSGEVETLVTRMETAIKQAYPEVRRVFIEAQSFDAHRRQQARDLALNDMA